MKMSLKIQSLFRLLLKRRYSNQQNGISKTAGVIGKVQKSKIQLMRQLSTSYR